MYALEHTNVRAFWIMPRRIAPPLPAAAPARPQAHPFFAGVPWEKLYSLQPPYRPPLEHELDTQASGRGGGGPAGGRACG